MSLKKELPVARMVSSDSSAISATAALAQSSEKYEVVDPLGSVVEDETIEDWTARLVDECVKSKNTFYEERNKYTEHANECIKWGKMYRGTLSRITCCRNISDVQRKQRAMKFVEKERAGYLEKWQKEREKCRVLWNTLVDKQSRHIDLKNELHAISSEASSRCLRVYMPVDRLFDKKIDDFEKTSR